eukprot:gb/GECH01013054.1/.p1 GENE.gb/GECH01013054.1/~~gb/GECH01013054.1/.p1  ORF type:complete len:284 (+),score=86.75 gb/GECH01013054.1/:1-852(+)
MNQDTSKIEQRMSTIRHKIMVLSGKGGVGKSTLTTQMALSLVKRGYKVGVLDIDICGPSVPHIFGLQNHRVHQSDEGWVPVYTDESKRLSVMSIGFLIGNSDDAVIWRGPKKNALIRQFLQDVFWDELDFLLIDTPPGTSDEHISIAEMLRQCNPDGAVLVSTPQNVSLSDVRKELNFSERVGFNCLGIVENMSGYTCPCCGEVTHIFSTGGGETMSKEFRVPFLGRIPIDPQLAASEDEGNRDYITSAADSASGPCINGAVDLLLQQIKEANNKTTDNSKTE